MRPWLARPCLLFLLATSHEALATPAFPACEVDDTLGRLNLWPCSTYWKGELSPQEAWERAGRGEFTPTTGMDANQGYTSSVFWVHVRLRFSSNQNTRNWLLSHPFRYTHDLQVWIGNPAQGSTRHVKGGLRPLEPSFGRVFESLGGSEVTSLFLGEKPRDLEILARIHADSATDLTLVAHTHQDFAQDLLKHTTAFGAFAGIMLILSLLALNMWHTSRRTFFLWFAAHLLSFLAAHGDVVDLYGGLVGRGWLARRFNHFGYVSSAAFFLLFVRSMSDSRKGLLMGRRLLLALATLSFPTLMALAVTPVPVSAALTGAYGAFAMFAFLALLAHGLWTKDTAVRRLIPACLIISLGVFVHILMRAGFVPNTLVTEHSMTLAVAMESVLLLGAARRHYVQIEISLQASQGELSANRARELRERLLLALGIADRINSPVTALLSISDRLGSLLLEIRKQGSARGVEQVREEEKQELEQKLERALRTQCELGNVAKALLEVSNELSQFRESDERIPPDELALAKGSRDAKESSETGA